MAPPFKATLIVVGSPLADGNPLDPLSVRALQGADLFIGESRKMAFPILKQVFKNGIEKEVLLLDPDRDETLREIRERLLCLAKTGGTVALFSDTGMPILFDPGKVVLDLARSLGFAIRCAPSATSWATACAVSGLEPPFWLEGFLPRDSSERIARLKALSKQPAHIVLLDTPYRFHALLTQAQEALGKSRQSFLAWEIASENELFFWGSLTEIAANATKHKLEKGEFILIVNRSA